MVGISVSVQVEEVNRAYILTQVTPPSLSLFHIHTPSTRPVMFSQPYLPSQVTHLLMALSTQLLPPTGMWVVS